LWTISDNNQYFDSGSVSIGKPVNIPEGINSLALDISGNLHVSRYSYFNNTIQSFSVVSWASSIPIDYRTGSMFYLSGGVSSNFTVNIQYLPAVSDTTKIYTISLIYPPSNYYCNAVTFSDIDASQNATAILSGSAPENQTLVIQNISLFCDGNEVFALMDIKAYA
jgi:hypothetical protein